MSYAEQEWRDAPDTTTPLSAARLAHMERGIKDAYLTAAAAFGGQATQDAAIAARALKSRLTINVLDYGAAPTGGGDGTAAIAAAIAALPTTGNTRGGTIFFPKGRYLHTGLDVSQTYGITFQGEGSGNGSYNASQLQYTAAGARGIDARSSNGFTLRNMDVRYSNTDFTGPLIDFAHKPPSVSDAAFMKFQGCRVGSAVQEGSAAMGCQVLVSLANAIFGRFEDTWFQGAQRGIRGLDPVAPGYSNAMQFANCTFDHLPVYCIGNPGQAWHLDGCNMEGISVLAGAASYTFVGFDAGIANTVINFVMDGGCWIGDVGFHASKALFDAPAGVAFNGLNIEGNFITSFQGSNPGIRILGLVRGGRIVGNEIAASPQIDISTNVKRGLRIENNRMAGGQNTTTTAAIADGATTIPVVSTANFADRGLLYLSATDDIFAYTGKTATSFTGVTGAKAAASGANITNGVMEIRGQNLGHHGLVIDGNIDVAGSNLKAPAKRMFSGHLLTQRESYRAPTITVGPNIGSGATASLDAGSNDTAGRIVIVTGTGPTAGAQRLCTVTFGEPYVTEGGVVQAYPHVLLTIRRSDTLPPPDLYSPNGSLTAFEIWAAATVAVSTVFVIDYFVIQ
jgi:hypothetical protein